MKKTKESFKLESIQNVDFLPHYHVCKPAFCHGKGKEHWITKYGFYTNVLNKETMQRVKLDIKTGYEEPVECTVAVKYKLE